ncbi:MAG: zinc ribbon domain-containing protein [Planctomycetaceae bacterium]|nr:zinc ribbon domain-containing protein [Planctomycetales bacterium]MCB9921670.1 zinc ribbon domain-containing protein [Planctomycetaceae bacterium]
MDAINVTNIICPGCGTELAPTAAICHECGVATSQAATETNQNLKRLLDRPWVLVVLILHIGFLGIPVYWKTKYSLPARLFMVTASIAYTIGAIAFIVFMLKWLIQLFAGG